VSLGLGDRVGGRGIHDAGKSWEGGPGELGLEGIQRSWIVAWGEEGRCVPKKKKERHRGSVGGLSTCRDRGWGFLWCLSGREINRVSTHIMQQEREVPSFIRGTFAVLRGWHYKGSERGGTCRLLMPSWRKAAGEGTHDTRRGGEACRKPTRGGAAGILCDRRVKAGCGEVERWVSDRGVSGEE